ncbi:hypothetical protein [Acidomonas methanolica]|uniref:Uncharacterized protein n=1 Tax=Acidomonas methanolica NBRC 104435 TaxID=1231351 RepID=A0A023D8U8_ACIMT|nr:hypothetical protein [Acidomonas methanolica]MBU2653779.1 hypothetical protein [Acidomonas methanolica]TCS31732.1 hypothetical protein EDC31_102284 [Acidomonas methanolica]GAJ30196.1 hypothetical protein Amme_111_021 [Acidomonas methanolica NBRC 104435]GBQ50714.1 hypothetical protein AA0498_1277 [Acidomonas methanolica]GEK98148.1 hypothetical protein AME01nite_06470 [Acidomonas methanolica NBRC 104435]
MPAPYETLRDDLSFLRAIAAEGRDRPLTAGPWIFSAGLIYGMASLVCWAIFASFLAACCAAWTSGSQIVWMTFPSFVLATYGAGWSVTGLIAGRRELRWVAVLSFIGAVALLPAFRTSALFLVYGVLILCVAALPGWRLMRLARDAGHG